MKPKTLKIATLLILFTLSSLNLLSQNLIYDKNFALKQIQASSSLIFEGKILSAGKSFRGKDSLIYTPYETQVDKIIYGKKTSSTINIIMDGGNIEENGSYFGTDVEDGLQIKLNNTSVIFCTPFTFGNLPSAYKLTSQVVYDANNEIRVRNGLAQSYENKNVNDLYKDLSKQFNIRIPQKKSPIISQNTKINKINTDSVATHNANYNKHITFFTTKYNNRRSQKINQVLANNLIISTGNELITYAGSNRFLEFDVFAKTNTSGLYFDNCLIRLQYNSASFGSNMMATGNATITKGASFNSATYLNPNTNFIDQTPNTLGILFGIDLSQSVFNRTLLTTTDKVLLHIKLKIQNCGQSAGLQLVDASTISNFSFYTTTANATSTAGIRFDNTTYTSPANNLLCAVIVNNFNTPIQGGIGSVFTINGFNFGTTRGNGKVRFRDANAQNFPFLNGLDNENYLSWTDTQIRIKMPSRTTFNAAAGGYPGSGAFIVKNNAGDSIVTNASVSPLNINYSISTSLVGVNRFRLNIKNANTLGGYTIRLDTSISNYPNRKGCVIKAMKDWRCKSGVNLILGIDANNIPQMNDGITTIAFTPTLSSNVIAVTFLQAQFCPSIDTVSAIPDFDIRFTRQNNYLYDTTGTMNLPAGWIDFYEVLTHEIGHGLGLLHVIDENAIMYRTAKTSATLINAASRKKLLPNSGDSNGALSQVTISPSNLRGQCTNFTSHQIVTSVCNDNLPINTSSLVKTVVCNGNSLTVPFTINGVFNAGNVFTAQLSNASGSFSATTAIGTRNSTLAGNINALIPINTVAGTGYRVRVVSSNPVITGSDNGLNITVKKLVGDFNYDGVVDVDDFSIFAPLFGTACTCPSDLNNNGFVNVDDFAIFAPAFGKFCQ